jgi:hypothetical protein
MALVASALTKVAGGAKQIWHYQTADAIATVIASGYFNGATENLRQFDVINVVGGVGGTVTVDVIVVTSATNAATVTTVNGT